MYLASPLADRLCDRDECGEEAPFTAVASDGAIVEHLCTRHVSQHMRGNAYALDGGDGAPDVREAVAMNELDKWELGGG